MAFTIKKNDTSPNLTATLNQGSPAAAINLAGATVSLVMKMTDGTNPLKAAATVTDAANGKVAYLWNATDTDTAGTFNCEWEITFSGGRIQTVPNTGYFQVVIEDDLG